MFINGFKFGMILQFAVGPVCLYILNISLLGSLPVALCGMLGVTLVDALFVMLAIFGIDSLLSRSEKISRILRYMGGIILIIFGMMMLYSIIKNYQNEGLLKELDNAARYHISAGHAFINAMLLTLSSPLTIIFWGGVFATKISDEMLSKQQLYRFGFGAVSATFFSLTMVALIASRLSVLFSPFAIFLLNSLVSILLIGYGLRQLFIRDKL